MRTAQEAASAWSRATSAAARSYMQEQPLEDQYESVRESYARGDTTFEELGRRIDELLGQGLK